MPLALNHRLKKNAYPFSMDLQSVLNMCTLNLTGICET